MELVLYGYHFSVYVRIVRMVLTEKAAIWRHVEVDPFSETVPQSYLLLNPFGRVPTLVDGHFVLYETNAITRYIDDGRAGSTLQPSDPRLRARMNQLISIADTYAYWPMVRQVFSQTVFNASLGTKPDKSVVAQGLEGSAKVLSAMEDLIEGGPTLVGQSLTLADLHLGPMFAYFAASPEGASMLGRYEKLHRWWAAFRKHPSLLATDPGLPSAA